MVDSKIKALEMRLEESHKRIALLIPQRGSDAEAALNRALKAALRTCVDLTLLRIEKFNATIPVNMALGPPLGVLVEDLQR